MSLFDQSPQDPRSRGNNAPQRAPLAERMRPRSLDEFFGQSHLLGAGMSHEALSLAAARITIPCRIESFNAAIAGSILMYEAARQSSPSTTDEPSA